MLEHLYHPSRTDTVQPIAIDTSGHLHNKAPYLARLSTPSHSRALRLISSSRRVSRLSEPATWPTYTRRESRTLGSQATGSRAQDVRDNPDAESSGHRLGAISKPREGLSAIHGRLQGVDPPRRYVCHANGGCRRKRRPRSLGPCIRHVRGVGSPDPARVARRRPRGPPPRPAKASSKATLLQDIGTLVRQRGSILPAEVDAHAGSRRGIAAGDVTVSSHAVRAVAVGLDVERAVLHSRCLVPGLQRAQGVQVLPALPARRATAWLVPRSRVISTVSAMASAKIRNRNKTGKGGEKEKNQTKTRSKKSKHEPISEHGTTRKGGKHHQTSFVG